MADKRQKETWELQAEELIRLVGDLLDHRERLENALREPLGRARAKARMDQLEGLFTALDAELWRSGGIPQKQAVWGTSTAVKWALRAIGVPLAAAVTTMSGLGAADLYEAVTKAEAHAEKVENECHISAEATVTPDTIDASGTVHPPTVSADPPTVGVTPGDVTVDEPRGDLSVESGPHTEANAGTASAVGTAYPAQVVTGSGLADLGFEATATGQVGLVDERDEALPVSTRSGHGIGTVADEGSREAASSEVGSVDNELDDRP